MKKSLKMLGIIGLSSLMLAGCGHQSQENHSSAKQETSSKTTHHKKKTAQKATRQTASSKNSASSASVSSSQTVQSSSTNGQPVYWIRGQDSAYRNAHNTAGSYDGHDYYVYPDGRIVPRE